MFEIAMGINDFLIQLVKYCNKKMADLLGYTLEESIGRPIWDFLSE
jgi:PAS domain-containing protein